MMRWYVVIALFLVSVPGVVSDSHSDNGAACMKAMSGSDSICGLNQDRRRKLLGSHESDDHDDHDHDDDGDIDYAKFCSAACLDVANSNSCTEMIAMIPDGPDKTSAALMTNKNFQDFMCKCFTPISSKCDDDHRRKLLSAHDSNPTEACCTAVMGNADCMSADVSELPDEMVAEFLGARKYCKDNAPAPTDAPAPAPTDAPASSDDSFAVNAAKLSGVALVVVGAAVLF